MRYTNLDYMVALSLGYELPVGVDSPNKFAEMQTVRIVNGEIIKDFSPSSNWDQAGKLMEEYKLALRPSQVKEYWICSSDSGWDVGDVDPRHAICRKIITDNHDVIAHLMVG